LIDEAVLSVDASRPGTWPDVAERLRFADAVEWVTPDRLNQVENARDRAWVSSRPVAQVVEESG
jgi:hypothetical protein